MIRKNIGALAFTAVMAAGSFTAAHADELIITDSVAKGGSSIAVDLVTEGSTVAFQFNIKLPRGVKPSDVDLTKCVSDLPKSHSGQCNVAKGQIIGLVYNDQNVALPAGLVSVGRVGIKSGLSKGKLEVAYFEVNDASGRALEAKTSVSSEK